MENLPIALIAAMLTLSAVVAVSPAHPDAAPPLPPPLPSRIPVVPGLNADFLDDLDSTSFARSDHRHVPTYDGPITFSREGVNYTVETQSLWHENEHLYLRVGADPPVNWLTFRNVARLMGGHLATITSASENDHVVTQVLGPDHAVIGYTDAQEEGKWMWVTGEVAPIGRNAVYTNWNANEPSNSPPGEDAAGIIGKAHPCVPCRTHWNDVFLEEHVHPTMIVEIGLRQSGG